MDSEPKPMDCDRLADFRTKLAAGWLVSSEAARDLVAELLADRDHHVRAAKFEADRLGVAFGLTRQSGEPLGEWQDRVTIRAVGAAQNSDRLRAERDALTAELARLRARATENLPDETIRAVIEAWVRAGEITERGGEISHYVCDCVRHQITRQELPP